MKKTTKSTSMPSTMTDTIFAIVIKSITNELLMKSGHPWKPGMFITWEDYEYSQFGTIARPVNAADAAFYDSAELAWSKVNDCKKETKGVEFDVVQFSTPKHMNEKMDPEIWEKGVTIACVAGRTKVLEAMRIIAMEECGVLIDWSFAMGRGFFKALGTEKQVKEARDALRSCFPQCASYNDHGNLENR